VEKTDQNRAGTERGQEALTAAFAAFADLSGRLEDSYGALQAQVRGLQQQLAAANERERREARRNAELASRLAALLEALPGGVLMLDGDGVVRQLNGTASEFFGAPLKDTAWAEVRERAFHAAGDDGGDLLLQDGRTLSLAQRLLDPGPGRVLLFTDVTEHRKIQELLARHRRLASLGEMAAALAHQIRTPLSAALLYVDNARRAELPAERRDALLGKAIGCLHDLEQLIADMLRFARGASTAVTTLDIDELFAAVRRAAAAAAGESQTVSFRHDAPGLSFAGNREALTGAILNLVNNALQHAGPQARVEVSARRQGNDLEISVRDDGPGVPPEQRERIFEPFFTSRADGTGLGLAVVRSVARGHGGDAWLRDPPGGGAEFVIRLPLPAVERGAGQEAAA